MSTFSVPRKNNWVNSEQQQRSNGSSSGFAQQPFEDLMNWGQIRVSLMVAQYATGVTTTRNPKYRPPSIATKLVTIKSLRRFGRFTHWISFIGGTPFVWNAQSLKLDFYSSWQQKIVYFVMKVISMLYAVYLVLRLIHLNMYTDETFVHKMTHFMWTSAFLLIAVVNWNLIRQAEAVLDFINQFVFTVNLFEDLDRSSPSAKLTKLDELLMSVVVMAILQIPLLVAVHIVMPATSQYPASLILKDNYSIYIHALSLLVELAVYLSSWSVMIFYVCYYYAYSETTARWCKNIRTQIVKNKNSPSRGLLSYYRILQLLNRYCNNCTKATLMPGHKIIVLVMTVISSYGVVHLLDDAELMLYLANIVILTCIVGFQVIAYPTWSVIFKASNGIRTIFLPREPALAYQQKFLKSCGPLKMLVGSFYFFRPFTPMKFFRIEFTYTMKVHYYLNK